MVSAAGMVAAGAVLSVRGRRVGARTANMWGVDFPECVVGVVGRYERWDPGRHTEAFVELCADREVMRFPGGPMRRHAATDVSQRIADHWDAFGFGLWA